MTIRFLFDLLFRNEKGETMQDDERFPGTFVGAAMPIPKFGEQWEAPGDISRRSASNDFPAARKSAAGALVALRDRFDQLAEELDPVTATSEQATQAALLVEEIGRAAGHARKVLAGSVLEWFAKNEGGVRELDAGPEKYFWPDRSPGDPLVKDVSALGLALWDVRAYGVVLEAVLNNPEAAERVREVFRDIVESTMSKNAFLAGKAKKILGPEEWWNHYDRSSIDKLKAGPVAKLGVGNKRFMAKHRKGS